MYEKSISTFGSRRSKCKIDLSGAAYLYGLEANFQRSRRGFYFAISSKLSNLFDLFGTSKSGLDGQKGQDEEEEE